MINTDTSIIEIRNQLLKEGFEPIQVDAIKKILNGTTSFSEVTKKISFNNI
jgi:type II secretory ATPase GspE/PulE/Tfp pilus assembly ATPase PilB-like protein